MNAFRIRVESYHLALYEQDMLMGLAILNCKMDLLKNAYESAEPREEMLRVKQSVYYNQDVTDDCWRLRKKYNSLFCNVVLLLDRYNLLFAMPLAMRVRNILKRMIQVFTGRSRQEIDSV